MSLRRPTSFPTVRQVLEPGLTNQPPQPLQVGQVVVNDLSGDALSCNMKNMYSLSLMIDAAVQSTNCRIFKISTPMFSSF